MKMTSDCAPPVRSKECCEVIRFAPAVMSCDATMRSADPAVRAMRVRGVVLWCACVVISWAEAQAQDDPTDNETRSFGEFIILNTT